MAGADRKTREMNLTRSLVLAARHWRRLGGAMARTHGLSEATLYPLVLLGRMEGPVRQNALAEAVGIEGPSLVRLLDQLEQAGLIRREEDPSDRRAKTLSLTGTGRARIGRIEKDLEVLRAMTFADLPDADLDAADRVMHAVLMRSRTADEATA